jgi:hypothetical protein
MHNEDKPDSPASSIEKYWHFQECTTRHFVMEDA